MQSRFAAVLVIVAGVGTLHPLAARAQSTPTGSPSKLAQGECAPGSRAPTLGENNSTRNLSDRLAESKGVICPPHDVDPQMNAPPPAEGNTPVIPPPGAPGGQPNVRPR